MVAQPAAWRPGGLGDRPVYMSWFPSGPAARWPGGPAAALLFYYYLLFRLFIYFQDLTVIVVQ